MRGGGLGWVWVGRDGAERGSVRQRCAWSTHWLVVQLTGFLSLQSAPGCVLVHLLSFPHLMR